MLTKVLSESQFNKKYPLLSDRQLKLKYGTSEGAVRAWDSRGRGTQTPKTEPTSSKSPNAELASIDNSSQTIDKLKTREFSERHSLDSENIEGGVNKVEFVTIKGDGKAIYKLTGSTKEALTEEYVYNIDKQLNFGLVPPTIGKPTGNIRFSGEVLQARALDCKSYDSFNTGHPFVIENINVIDSIKMQILDDITLNTDRHGRNFLVTNKTDKDGLNRLIAIDNGLSFTGNGVMYSRFFSQSTTQRLYIKQSKKIDFTNEIKSIRGSINKINPDDYIKQVEKTGIRIDSDQHKIISDNIKKWQSDEHWKSITK